MNAQTDSPDDPSREDLLERYVLGRMTPAEREEFETRLAVDPSLQEDVRREREIVGGVRRAGREELRGRLAAKLAAYRADSRPGVPWGRIAALAAMVLVVTGIALWQRWFFPPSPGGPMAVESVAPGQDAGAPPHEAESSRSLSGTTPAPEEEPGRVQSLPDRAPSANTLNETDRAIARDERSPAPGTATTARQSSVEAKRATSHLAAAGRAEWRYESAGILLPDGAADRPGETRGMVDAAAPAGSRLSKTEGLAESGTAEVDTRAYQVTVSPERRGGSQGDRAKAGRDTVEFSVAVRGDSVTITLPAGMLASGKDASSDARVTRISPDSVIIEAQGVRIRGYLPLGPRP